MTPESAVEIVAVLTGVIAVIVSLVTASGAVKQTAFNSVIAELRKSLEDEKKARHLLEKDLELEKKERRRLEADLEKEQKRRDRIERWARALAGQLHENHITPIKLEDIE
jgi:septal ring factor EnvC (AmiA/AmiB activator)